MKVHPVPRKRNITLRYDIVSSLSEANALAGLQKKLRRLPHIFAKVLELPFHSDADVFVQETSDFFQFVVNTDQIADEIRAHTIEIYPGVTKIVIRETNANVLDFSVDELELDMWRFRLPASTLPEQATAAYSGGELVVTVPKNANFDDEEEEEEEEEGGVWGGGNGSIGAGRLVFVQ
ncbi:hypothetical protein ACSBR1_021666 [Camellia fascicularis]